MLRHLTTTMRGAKHDMLFVTEMRGPHWLEVKNLHMVCVEESVFVIFGQVDNFFIGLSTDAGKLEDASGPLMGVKDDGWCKFVVSHVPTQSTPMTVQARSTCFSDGTVNKLLSHTLGGLIIGGGFN